MLVEEFDKFKNENSSDISKAKAVHRLTGECITDLDLYLAYIIKTGVKIDLETDLRSIISLHKSGETSGIFEFSEFHIQYKNWRIALKYPEYSIFVTNMKSLFGVLIPRFRFK